MEESLQKIADDFGLTTDGVRFALEQYQAVLQQVTCGDWIKLTYPAHAVIDKLFEYYDKKDEWIYCKDQLPEDIQAWNVFTDKGAKWFPGAHVFAACRSLIDDREPWTVDVFYAVLNGKRYWGHGYSAIPMIEMGQAEVYAWKPKIFPEPPEFIGGPKRIPEPPEYIGGMESK